MKLPTGQWGTPHYSQTSHWGTAAVWSDKAHQTLKPMSGSLIRYFGTNNHLLIYALCVILPNGQLGTPITSNRPLKNRQLYAVIRRIKHLKQCLGAPMCYFGTNGPLLIYALCMILPTCHWGTPHYSQRATEEWLHLTAIWGIWKTLNIENHLGGPWCVISGPIIVSWCIMCDTPKQASEECPIIPNRPLRNGSFMGR